MLLIKNAKILTMCGEDYDSIVESRKNIVEIPLVTEYMTPKKSK